MVTTPVCIISMIIFIFLKPTNLCVYIFFALLLYVLSSFYIFFCGAIFGNLFLVDGRPKWLVLAFFGAVVITGCSVLVGASFLRRKPPRQKKYHVVDDEETPMTKDRRFF